MTEGEDGPWHLKNELVWAVNTEGVAAHYATRKFSFLQKGRAYISVHNPILLPDAAPSEDLLRKYPCQPPTVLHTSQDNIHSCLLAGQKKKINKKEKGEGLLEQLSNTRK